MTNVSETRDCENCIHYEKDFKTESGEIISGCATWECEFEPLEQEPTTKNDLGVDCISRAEALNCLKATELKKFDWIIDAREKISNLPSVTPQEPVLDKIFCIVHPLSIMSTPELEHKAIMQIAEMLEPLCLQESE